jgi:hypothetical protein
MIFFGFSFMPDQMHSYAQCVLLIFKGVARCAGAAFRPMPHQSPTSGASSVPRAIRPLGRKESGLGGYDGEIVGGPLRGKGILNLLEGSEDGLPVCVTP